MASGINCVELEKLKQSVQVKFDRIREALNVREKLLLRQIDVISASQMHKNVTTSPQPQSPSLSVINDETEFISENEEELLALIRTFGKFNLDNINMALQNLYANEDYISPAIDHETMYKCLENIQSTKIDNNDENCNNENEEKIIVDFSNNRKLFRDNVNNINESIINITLNEAKELIKKSKPSIPLMSLNLNLANDKNLSDIIISDKKSDCDSIQINSNKNSKDQPKEEEQQHKSQSSQTDLKEKIKINPKITINNCNGTINLKNISNLTINCSTEGSFSVPNDNQNVESSSTDHESKQIETPYSPSDENDNNNDNNNDDDNDDNDISCTNNSTVKDNENNSVNCEFYNRLLNEIKNSLKQKTSSMTDNAHYQQYHKNKLPNESSTVSTDTNYDSNFTTTNDSTTSCNANKKYILKNFENLKIIMENNTDNSADAHPVQIEQWLTEIISETEIEPMQNTDILEHSRINDELC